MDNLEPYNAWFMHTMHGSSIQSAYVMYSQGGARCYCPIKWHDGIRAVHINVYRPDSTPAPRRISGVQTCLRKKKCSRDLAIPKI